MQSTHSKDKDQTQEKQEVWQAYDNLYFLKLNLEKLPQEDLDQIIRDYFVKDDVEGESGIKMSEEYLGTVLVKESQYTIE